MPPTGEWVDGLPGLGDIAIRVRRFGNPDHERERARMLRTGPVDDGALAAATILTGWRNVEHAGQPLDFTAETARALLCDPALGDLLAGVQAAADIVTRAHHAAMEADGAALTALMTWSLAWSADAIRFLEEERAANPDFDPPALRNRPELPEHLAFVWRAFGELATERTSGFGVGPIPWSAIEAYADRAGIADVDERADFKALIRVLDDVVVKHHAEAARKSTDKRRPERR